MKTLIISIFILGMTAMAQTNSLNTSAMKDTTVKDPETQEPILLGYCTRQAFQDTNYSWWFESVYDMYEVDSTAANSIRNKLNDVSVTVVMGTWCSDSRREVPKLFKILDYLKFPADKISILTVGRDMKARGNEAAIYKIKKIPTIIFYKGSTELGRIVESPEVSLEKDMQRILKG